MNNFNCSIKAIESSFPKNFETNSNLKSDNPQWNIEEIERKTGINKRWISSSNETAVDLAFKACEKILLKVDLNTIDTLILVTQSPDYFLPTSACILHEKLSLNKNTKCFDINLGCSGFVYGLSVATSYIQTHLSNKVLLVCAETYTKFIDKNDRTNRPIFSDAATATLITRSKDANIGPFLFGTNGKGYSNLIVKEGAAKSGYVCNDKTQPTLHMDGSDVFMFTMSEIPKNVDDLIAFSEFKKENIDMFIFHQGSKIVLDTLQSKLSIPNEKFYSNLKLIGNTVSSTIPLALKDASDNLKIQANHIILISGFGVGLSWGSCLIKWNDLI